ncbi:MAG: diacylglycerol kinase family lipid kinase [Ruminococcus sp.]|nr:diacylglycerol kinase family lipid kinase [Ruminococcus sp.]
MKKLLFVYNPHSGKGQINDHLGEIIDIFTKGGFDVTAHPTQERGDAFETVMTNASGYELVVCSGGDGTTNETIKGIMNGGHHIPVGIIPAGTMNDFSSSLGISKYMPDAARTIMSGSPEFVDIGAFNDQYFTYVAAFGAFTKVSYATDQQMKNSLGALAYFIEAVKTIDYNQRYNITIECDGETITDDFMFGMVANSLSVGGIKGLAGNDIMMNDGIFEGIFIRKPATLIEFQQTLNALIKKEFDAPYFYYFKASNFTFRSDGTVPWTLDGEYGGSSSEISLCVLHDALRIVVDKSKSAGINENRENQ